MAQQSLLTQGLLNIDSPWQHSVGLLWTNDRPDAQTYAWQHTTHIYAPGEIRTPPPIPESKQPQTHALGRAATGIGGQF